MNIDIQLFSVSDEFKKDEVSTLKFLAGVGYTGVEFAFGFGHMPPEELRVFLESINLKAVGIYSENLESLSTSSDNIYTYVRCLKIPYVTVGSGEVEN
jgi:hypothetical protein